MPFGAQTIQPLACDYEVVDLTDQDIIEGMILMHCRDVPRHILLPFKNHADMRQRLQGILYTQQRTFKKRNVCQNANKAKSKHQHRQAPIHSLK